MYKLYDSLPEVWRYAVAMGITGGGGYAVFLFARAFLQFKYGGKFAVQQTQMDAYDKKLVDESNAIRAEAKVQRDADREENAKLLQKIADNWAAQQSEHNEEMERVNSFAATETERANKAEEQLADMQLTVTVLTDTIADIRAELKTQREDIETLLKTVEADRTEKNKYAEASKTFQVELVVANEKIIILEKEKSAMVSMQVATIMELIKAKEVQQEPDHMPSSNAT